MEYRIIAGVVICLIGIIGKITCMAVKSKLANHPTFDEANSRYLENKVWIAEKENFKENFSDIKKAIIQIETKLDMLLVRIGK